ncbi:YceI family protein [Rhodocaloribacter litoris]|uniref:YceI family protein n=1 Tax=Rhodocaloribacter litoris TaxID=2558931 RepID=UPI00141ED8C9|nr:YceI family protein [Rhodocaloribacter litoris]QXD14075.1 YceI family protein [Rhodocaloribacter litoris]
MKHRTHFLLLPVLVAVLLLAGFVNDRPKAVYKADLAHSYVGFQVRHLGVSNVKGRFKEYDVTLEMEGTDLRTLKASGTVNVNSIDTGIERRDNHLRSPDFFEVETFPTITFVSKEVRNIDGNAFELVGDLTIKDVTKEVMLEAEFLGTAKMGDSERAGFTAETTINRKDFNLTWDRLTEAGGLVVGHDVKLVLEIEAIKQ